MIKGGDVRALLQSTEDALIEPQSLGLVGSDPSGSYGSQEHEQEGFMDQDSDEENGKEKEDSAFLSESDDPAAERNSLMAQIKVLDAMLRQIEAEEQRRVVLESPLPSTNANDIASKSVQNDHSVSHKRQRRPNPKYFDSEIEADFLAPGSSPSVTFRTNSGEELPAPLALSDSQSLQSAGNEPNHKNGSLAARPNVSSFFDHCSGRPAGTHRARTALAQKPRVFSLSEGSPRVNVKSDSYLDNLSIRELHETYRRAFGRDTSVKDKHWLKRQILTSKHNESSIGKENSKANALLPETTVKVRLEKHSPAEVPLSKAETTPSPKAVTSPDAKKPHCKTLSLASLSASAPPVPPPAVEERVALNAEGNEDNAMEAQNKEMPVCGKRLRKPNRRYIEDEGDESLSIMATGSQSILSTFLSAGSGLRPRALRLSWRSDEEVVGDGYKNGALRTSGLRASTRSSTCHGRRSKHVGNSMKRKTEGRAAKLVKLAHSARASRHDADGTVRKVKFRLPAAPGQDKGEVLNGGNGEQVSCLLPVLTDESSEDYQILSSHYLTRLEDTSDQAVVTVPTANGGTRRKHHRPWTLREVVTLVEGVARCGGGKWADIKKLAFAAVGYRTAVDLKDKWRNLLRASRAQLHPPKQGETRKKQFSASIPGHILARVRELAALNNQIIPAAAVATSTSRSGRTVHRR
ncbi:unnamed protein product [Calypogeia fissa]